MHSRANVNPLDIFIFAQKASPSNLSEFNCPEILVTQQWIDKKGEKKKLSYHAENAWEIYGVCNENYTTTSQLFSFIYGERVCSKTHKKGSKYLSIDNSFVRVFSSFYRHVFLHFIPRRCILRAESSKSFSFWGSSLHFLGCQVAKIEKIEKKVNLLCLEHVFFMLG